MMESAGRPHVEQLRDRKTEAIARIIKRGVRTQPKRILVVGCGSGLEVAILAQELQAQAIGIDLKTDFNAIAAERVTLQQGDATQLQFADESFDLVYSYHSLEHIPKYRTALSEMHRVLAEGGQYCVGTPNRLRLMGYIGSKDTSLLQKVSWNAKDWSARLCGKFRNEFGAHAGFSPEELLSALGDFFSAVSDVTFQYYMEVYSDKVRLVQLIHSSGFERFLFPSIYFVGPR